jgi:hypothetical protein
MLEQIRAENPDMPFKMAGGQALPQAWIEDRERACEEHRTA